MYRVDWKKELPTLLIFALTFAVLLWAYPRLPSQIVMHQNLAGQPDGLVTKNGLSVFGPLGLVAGIYWLLLLTPFLDKQNFTPAFAQIYRTITFSMVLFMCSLLAMAMGLSFGVAIPAKQMLFVEAALLLIVAGNFMGKVRRNRIFGLKTPWTLANDMVWNRSNRAGGKLFVLAGAAGLGSAFLPTYWPALCFAGEFFLALTISLIYSYRLSLNIKNE